MHSTHRELFYELKCVFESDDVANWNNAQSPIKNGIRNVRNVCD